MLNYLEMQRSQQWCTGPSLSKALAVEALLLSHGWCIRTLDSRLEVNASPRQAWWVRWRNKVMGKMTWRKQKSRRARRGWEKGVGGTRKRGRNGIYLGREGGKEMWGPRNRARCIFLCMGLSICITRLQQCHVLYTIVMVGDPKRGLRYRAR